MPFLRFKHDLQILQQKKPLNKKSRKAFEKVEFSLLLSSQLGSFYAEIAQLVERNLAKVKVAGSTPVFRSISRFIRDIFCQLIALLRLTNNAWVVELVDTQDLKSCGP